MNILFLSIGRLNDLSEKGIYTDLLREFKKNGHNVFVISPLEKRLGLKTNLSIEQNITVLRVKTGNLTKTNLISKGIATLTIEHLFLSALKKNYGNIKFDLILYSTPPITFEKVINYVKRRDGATSYLLLKDIFPQNAVDLHLITKKTPVYWYFRHKEKKLYRNSNYIGCMSPANMKYLIKHNPYLDTKTIEVCPNSIEVHNMEISPGKLEGIRVKYNIPLDKTVFLYGGNLGKPQGIDFLMKCIEANENNSNSFFLIVGSGTEFNKLNDFFLKKNPQNSLLLNQLDKSNYDLLAGSCDVGLILLDKRFSIPNFPSRILSYMQSSIPVLAATDKSTDVGEVITEGGFGYWCESGDLNNFMVLVNNLCDSNLRTELGSQGRTYLEKNYTVSKTYEIIMNSVEKEGENNV